MINKKLGVLLIIIAILIGFVLYSVTGSLKADAEKLGCFEQVECQEIEDSLTITHFAFGIVGFILALGVYLLFFYTGEREILKRLDEQKKNNSSEERFNIILSALDEEEASIVKAVKEQEGITQSTLAMRTGMSKSRLSETLKKLEGKKLVKREKKGKKKLVYCLKC